MGIGMVPKKMFFTKGVGKHKERLTSFELALRDAGLDISDEAKSKRDRRKIQDQFNAWAEETGLCYTHLSRICALSIGENRSTAAEED